MDNNLSQIKKVIYDNLNFKISDFTKEQESKEYYACRFKLNDQNVISRNSKVTPKKIGQFVTFWKRNEGGIIQPLTETDRIDFFTVNARNENKFGQFVFPKLELIKRGIITSKNKEGKRGFRVYPSWDKPKSKQAEKTQQWQLNYFYQINDSINYSKIANLYKSRIK